MIVAGCDIGSLTAKAVIMNDGKITASEVMQAKPDPEISAKEIMGLALNRAGLSMKDIEFCVGTGYGRKHIPFMNSTESEIACHARGAVWRLPSARMVIDIGGQDCKAVKMDDKGSVTRYVYNDKCASGTGRFLEIIAGSLDIALEDMGAISEKSSKKLTLSSQCVIFAETEIISLVNDGAEIPDIVNALHYALANRAASLARSIVVETDAVMSGGVAKNSGLFRALGEVLGVKLHSIENPQANGALGAALFAMDQMMVRK
jgi:predicted CoA-substrate-specific enzyme activase